VKFVRVVGSGRGHGRETEVPETWAEGERMIENALRYHTDRGGNLAIQSVCARVAFGMMSKNEVPIDPTQALAHLMWRICQRKGAGLDR
jgi:hypothetical protein